MCFVSILWVSVTYFQCAVSVAVSQCCLLSKTKTGDAKKKKNARREREREKCRRNARLCVTRRLTSWGCYSSSNTELLPRSGSRVFLSSVRCVAVCYLAVLLRIKEGHSICSFTVGLPRYYDAIICYLISVVLNSFRNHILLWTSSEDPIE